MPSFSRRNSLHRCRLQLRDRVEDLTRRNHATLLYALDHLLPERMDTFFTLEAHLETLAAGCTQVMGDLEPAGYLEDLERIEDRLRFLEDRWDEIDSRIRNRPHRRPRGWSLADLFRRAQGSSPWSGNGADGIADAAEAYGILGIKPGAPFKQATRAFRRRVKELHPDARGGDRSAEPQLRRLLAAYDFLKQSAVE